MLKSWIPSVEIFTLRVMHDGRMITVEVTADGAGLVSRAGTALLGQVADRVGLTSGSRRGWRESSSDAAVMTQVG